MDSIFYGEGFSPLAMKNVSIKHLQLFEDRSDVACRVVIKTGVSVGGMVYVYCDGRGNLRVAKTPPLQSALRGDRWGDYRTTIIDAPWASMGNGVEANNNAARRVATSSEDRGNRF